MSDRLRLGRISYANMAPLFHRLETDAVQVSGVPTELNAKLCRGELDLAPISSIEWARHAERLLLLPRLCVSSEGAVDSIQIVSARPLERVRTLAVTSESATSAVLARVLLPDAEQIPLELESEDDGPPEDAAERADARLLIGDAALRSVFEDPTPHHDLGHLWRERTGLPMVYAVFATPAPLREGVVELEEELLEAYRLARAQREQLAVDASAAYGYPPGFLARYFEKLHYRFGPREHEGLVTFLELARDAGQLERVPELEFAPERATVSAES